MANAPLRIGYVLKRFPRFSETFILNELLSLQAQGVRTDVFSLLVPPEEPRHARLADYAGRVTYLADTVAADARPAPADAELFAGQSAGAVSRLIAKADRVAVEARRAGITHLHAHFASDAATVALLAARRIGGSFSMTAHARDIYHLYVDAATDAAKRRAKLQAAAFTVTVSDYNAAHLRALCPEAADRIHRLYNGIDLDLFQPATSSRVVNRIIAVGRLVEKKGFADLVTACGLLRNQGHALSCDIVGDGPLQATLAAQIAAEGLQDTVRLVGPMPQEQLAHALGTAAIATLPCIVTDDGDRDGLPTVLLEAMAKALPVVTTSVTGGPEIVDHGRTGLVCPPGNPAALAQALGALLADPGLAHRMGQAGRARAESLFDLHRNVAVLTRHFQSVSDTPIEGAA
ncbi:MAG: hypothetical protein RLZZ563_1146 [Pseudomonadota bacterium]